MSIEVKKLVKSYGDIEVLKNLNLEIETNSVTTLIGPSGSGKSTFLRCLNYLEKPDSGILSIDDNLFDFAKISKSEIKHLQSKSAMVFQNYNLFKNKTALENVIEGLVVAKGVPLKEAEQKGCKLLERVGLLHKANNYPVTLSGGEQQRVGIARALAVNPSILLFDEPTSALDPEKVSEVLDVIREIVADKLATIILVTHEMEFAKEISDKVYFMEKGLVVESGSPDKIFTNASEDRTRQFLKHFHK